MFFALSIGQMAKIHICVTRIWRENYYDIHGIALNLPGWSNRKVADYTIRDGFSPLRIIVDLDVLTHTHRHTYIQNTLVGCSVYEVQRQYSGLSDSQHRIAMMSFPIVETKPAAVMFVQTLRIFVIYMKK